MNKRNLAQPKSEHTSRRKKASCRVGVSDFNNFKNVFDDV